MNYYERHLGDYAKSTLHLSMIEHGAYSLLLDRYYVSEKGIPKNLAHRIARARTKDETRAVDSVLAEFFTLVDDVFINHRVEAELDRARNRIKAAQENGKRGGRPKKNPEGTENQPAGFPMGFENETQLKAYQTPDSRFQPPHFNEKTHINIPDSRHHELAARVCVEMREMGLMHVNSQHPALLELIASGVGAQEFISAASMAVRKSKGFAYALGIVNGRIQEKQNNQRKENANQKSATPRSLSD